VKRFLLFGGDAHCAEGGWNDFVDSFDSQEKAIASLRDGKLDWWHVVDTQTGEKVDLT